MEGSLERSRCDARTLSGTLCAKGKRRCRIHGGLSTGPKTVAGKARIAAAQFKHGRYVNWRARRAKEKLYYKQIRMVMAQAREAGFLAFWDGSSNSNLKQKMTDFSENFGI